MTPYRIPDPPRHTPWRVTRWQKRAVRYRKWCASVGWEPWHAPVLAPCVALTVSGAFWAQPWPIAAATTIMAALIPMPWFGMWLKKRLG